LDFRMFSLLGFFLFIALALWLRSVSLEQRRMAGELAMLRRELDRLPAGGAAAADAEADDEPAEPQRVAPESTGTAPETEGPEPKAAEATDAARLTPTQMPGRRKPATPVLSRTAGLTPGHRRTPLQTRRALARSWIWRA
jgi:hypothetical protein